MKNRKYNPLPSQEYLKSLLDYDEETGILTWINHPTRPRKNGTPAGNLQKDGYWLVCFNTKTYRTHRLIWMMENGEDPKEMEIDHIDGVTWNNRIDNLRVVTRTENHRNQKKYETNTSGATGVRYEESKDGLNWVAQIGYGSTYQRKRFYTFEEALAQRLAWEKERGYTDRCRE